MKTKAMQIANEIGKATNLSKAVARQEAREVRIERLNKNVLKDFHSTKGLTVESMSIKDAYIIMRFEGGKILLIRGWVDEQYEAVDFEVGAGVIKTGDESDVDFVRAFGGISDDEWKELRLEIFKEQLEDERERKNERR